MNTKNKPHAEQPAEEARGVDDVRQRFERIKRLALDAGGQGALPVPQSLRKIVRECLDGVALLAAPAAGTGSDVADRLDAMADNCAPGSQQQSDLYAAATAWRKHIAGKQAATGAQGLTDELRKTIEAVISDYEDRGYTTTPRMLRAILAQAASKEGA